MNLVLFEESEIGQPLPLTDRRAVHILNVLRCTTGQAFDAGAINGPRGKACLERVTTAALYLSFNPTTTPAPRPPLTLIVGLPRPQTARDILRDATTLGVAAMHFVTTDRGESSYAQSSLWSTGEWRRQALQGAEQAFDTVLPEITFGRSLSDAIAVLPRDSARLALDNYEATHRLGDIQVAPGNEVTMAIGAERGWSARERDLLRAATFQFAHCGPRVLRTETAVIAALVLLRAKIGLL